MTTFLFGFITFGTCLFILGGYLAVVDSYLER